MIWTYEQRTGRLLLDGIPVGVGYSGFGPHRNVPESQARKSEGPIPRGRWRIGTPFFHKLKGPYVMRLDPLPGTETFGRSGFLIHGDSIRSPGTASLGCIVLNRELRMTIGESGVVDLEVVEG